MARLSEGELWQKRVEAYRELRRITDEDALHDVIERLGPEVLDRDLPYLLVVVRNRTRDRMRSQTRRDRREQVVSAAHPGSVLDPLEAVLADEGLSEVLLQLSTLDERDGWLVWWASQGHSTRELQSLWGAAGFEPENPTEAMIRKRLSRARERLAAQLDAGAQPHSEKTPDE